MTQFSWPVALLAVITLLAGAIVGDALRSGLGVSRTADMGVYYVTNTGR